MVDVGRQHGASASYLLAYELRRDVRLDAQLFAVHVFADGDVLHLGRDDAGLRVGHLRDGFVLPTFLYPGFAHPWQAFLQVNGIVGVGVGTACVVDVDGGIRFCMGDTALVLRDGGGEVHLRHSHLDVWEDLSRHVGFLALGVCFVVVWHLFLFYVVITL